MVQINHNDTILHTGTKKPPFPFREETVIFAQIKLQNFLILVGVKGFEPSTPCSQSRCANQTALHPDNRPALQSLIQNLGGAGGTRTPDLFLAKESRSLCATAPQRNGDHSSQGRIYCQEAKYMVVSLCHTIPKGDYAPCR